MKIIFQDDRLNTDARIREIHLEFADDNRATRGVVRCDLVNNEATPYVTWSCEFDGLGFLVCTNGHYFFPGEESKAEADFANRAVMVRGR